MVLTSAPIAEDGEMSSPRAGGPSRRRSFTPAQKLHHLAEYETACENGQGGAYLRREGLYSSLISEWRRLRDAGLLEGKLPGTRVGRPSSEQAELARLRRELAEAERKLAGRTPWIGPGRVRVRSMGADRSVGHRAEVAQG